ncbi:hypothetical protein L5B97_00335 [Avibacterium sp. 20-15]|uniref:hypothetical protein n=1 Tax=unclassified Avibacterium TaxID=2685287 RepID=UPI0020273D4C|nr:MULTISPECIES: hypothetical protein [unclassified Avibacterium]MCW9731949.1 hypothetical protein [Avibacterium sp. 20-15]URL04138.1 hypothetical protein L4F93_11415 [Avibacterium sp. 20-132]
MTITQEQFFGCADIPIEQHIQFEKYLTEILFHKQRREAFYKALQPYKLGDAEDTFKHYFETYSAERKTFRQDYTPSSLATILSKITHQPQFTSSYSGYDPTAGTGGLIISKWWANMTSQNPFSYKPSQHFYLCEEKADNVIPYLLHNLAMRGMNAIVIHGDVLERATKQIYFIFNAKDDYLTFSDINVLPHTEDFAKEFNIHTWLEDEIKHIESPKITLNNSRSHGRR